MRIRSSQGQRREAGRGRPAVASLELAAVAPVVLLLLAGLVDLGRLVRIGIVLENAARAGAEAGTAAAFGADDLAETLVWRGRITEAVRQELAGQDDVDPTGLDVKEDFEDDAVEGIRAVRVEVRYTGFRPLFPWFGPTGIPIPTSTVRMRAGR